MVLGLGEMLPGVLLDTLNFLGQGTSVSGPITVASTSVAYGRSFPLPRGVTFGWEIQFSSLGTTDVKIELEQSNQRPATEGSSDTAWAIPDNKVAAPLFAEITDKNVHFTAYSPDATAFGRFKFTGLGTNAASTAAAVARVYRIKNN